MKPRIPLLCLVVCACGPTTDCPTVDCPTAETPDSGGTASGLCWDALSDLDEFSLLVSCYGTLDTLAGKGEIPTKNVNGWESSFEGGPALDAELSRPHMSMADTDGNIYIADKDAHAIRKVDIEGLITTIAGTGAPGDDGDGPGLGTEMRLSSPNGLWVAADGTVYIHDMGNNKVRALAPDGQLETLFSVPDSGTGRGIWVADDASAAYLSSGSTLRQWTPQDGQSVLAAGFSSLGNLVLDPNGDVVVTDRGGHTVTRVFADGTQERIAGTGTTSGGGDGQAALDTGLDEVRGVWFHPLGGYFLATHAAGQIWYVDTEGTIHLFLDGDADGSHSGDGERFDTPGKKISEPRAIVMAPDGTLLITENDAGYVRRVSLTAADQSR